MALVAVSLVSYIVLAKLVVAAVGVSSESRTELLAPSDLVWRTRQTARAVVALLRHDSLIPKGLAAAQIGLLAAVIALASWRCRRQHIGVLPTTIALLSLALLAVIGILAILQSFAPMPRSLLGLGFFWSGSLALLATLLGPRWNVVVVGICIALTLRYVGLDHRVAADQRRLNGRELAMAGKILGRIELMPGYAALRTIVPVNHPRVHSDIGSAAGDATVSAFFAPWSQAAVFAESSGQSFAVPTAADREIADGRCASSTKWPSQGSVAFVGDVGIVCF